MKYQVTKEIDVDMYEVLVELDGDKYTGHLSQAEIDSMENMTERDFKSWDVFRWSFWIDLHNLRGWEHEKL